MSQKVDLRLDWCSYEAAKYAVEHWHYSKCMPAGKSARLGVWESDKFIGCVIYSWGANRNIGRPYNLEMIEVCELVRVAIGKHVNPVSKIVSLSKKMLVKQSPGLRLIVSYADPEEGHNGAIYQAMNWLYVGASLSSEKVLYKGKWVHKRTVDSAYGNHKGFPARKTGTKHTYLMPLDEDMRKQIEPLRKPYPKREICGTGETDNAVQSNAQTGGASPTVPLYMIQNENSTP